MIRLRLAARETFRSLQVRNFRLFFGGQLVSQIGNWLTITALTLLVLKLTDSGVALGLLAAARPTPSTTRPGGRSWPSWCPRTTSATRSASTAP